MAAVATALVGDRYASSTSSSTSSSSGSSSSLSSSSGDTSEEDSSSSWSSSSSSSTCTSSASSDLSPSKKKKKKRDADNKKRKNPKKKSKKSTAVIGKRKKRTKSSKSLVGRDQDDDNEVGSMLLLGAELLKEVEEASSATSTAAAATAILMDKSRPAEPLPLPIGHYVIHGGPQNRAVLLEHVMSSVPAAQWQAILPPVLKEMNSAELKQLCLQQLQQLSDSAILNIINGGGDQGPAGKAVCSETGEGEGERSKKKKSKKSKKKKSAKAKKGERLEPTQEDQVEDESSGKTLMELLELEMRARAIKALLKKEEEGQGDDEWPADLVASSFDAPLTTPVQHIHRPLKTGEDASFSDKHKQSGARHAAHQHRSSVDPVPPTHCAQQPLNARPSRRPASLHQQTDDCVDFHRRDRHSSAKHDREQMLNKMTRQPRHYRHRHHERSRSPVRRAEPSTGGAKTEDTKHAAKSPPSRAVRGAVKSERRDNARGAHEKCDGTVQVAADEVEYEEEGIQEVDIELGSGSDDDSANSARL